MARDARQHVHPGGRSEIEADVGGGKLGAFVRREGERREPERRGVESEEKVVHHRVPGDGDLHDIGPLDSRRRHGLGRELVQRLAHRLRHLRRPVLVHHREGHAAHEVLPEPDLGVHPAEGGEHFAREEVAEVHREGGRADVHREAEGPVAEAGPDVDEPPAIAHERRRPIAGPLEGRVETSQGVQVDLGHAHPERLPKALLHASQVAGRVGEIRGRDLDVHRAYQGIDADVPGGRPLAHDLAVDLARLRHVGHEVPGDARLAGKAMSLLQPPRRELAPLPVAEPGEMVLGRHDAVLGELSLAHPHLATGADAAPPAHRVEVDPEPARGLEERRPGRKTAASSGRSEYDERAVSHRAGGPGGGGRVPRRPHRRPRPGGGRSRPGSCGRGPS